MALSAGLALWLCGLTNWYSNWASDSIYVMRVLEISLSSLRILALKLFLVNVE